MSNVDHLIKTATLLTPEDRLRLDRAAAADDRTLSDYLRIVVRDHLDIIDELDRRDAEQAAA